MLAWVGYHASVKRGVIAFRVTTWNLSNLLNLLIVTMALQAASFVGIFFVNLTRGHKNVPTLRLSLPTLDLK